MNHLDGNITIAPTLIISQQFKYMIGYKKINVQAY